MTRSLWVLMACILFTLAVVLWMLSQYARINAVYHVDFVPAHLVTENDGSPRVCYSGGGCVPVELPAFATRATLP